jgi:hypothetical protein
VDGVQGPVEVGAGLGVDDDQLAARFHVPAEEELGVAHHEMGLERYGGVTTGGGDDVGPECQVGDEVPVHHVPLDAVDPGLFQRRHLLTQPGEVGREDAGHDQNGIHVSHDTCCRIRAFWGSSYKRLVEIPVMALKCAMWKRLSGPSPNATVVRSSV